MLLIKAAGGVDCAHNTASALTAHTTGNMKLRAAVVWTLTVIISLFVEVHRAHKMKIHWGPQSMMYLKGKHGRRFVSEEDNRVLKQDLQDWYTLLKCTQQIHSSNAVTSIKGVQRLQAVEYTKPRQIVSSEKPLIQYLQER